VSPPEAVSVVGLPEQILVLPPVIKTLGRGLTFTVCVAVAEQLKEVVAVTEYIPVEVGETTMKGVVAFVLHKYDALTDPVEAVSVA
jgi:hypothetical protein